MFLFEKFPSSGRFSGAARSSGRGTANLGRAGCGTAAAPVARLWKTDSAGSRGSAGTGSHCRADSRYHPRLINNTVLSAKPQTNADRPPSAQSPTPIPVRSEFTFVESMRAFYQLYRGQDQPFPIVLCLINLNPSTLRPAGTRVL